MTPASEMSDGGWQGRLPTFDPFALENGTACGPERNAINALTASACFDSALAAAANRILERNSPEAAPGFRR
jgi:hypothetical protein